MKIKKEKHVPMRTCIQTRERLPKRDLLRFVYLKDEKKFIFDPQGKAKGRGANLRKNIEVFEKAIKSKAFNRAFKTNISIDDIDLVRKSVEKFLLREKLANHSNRKNDKISIRVKVDEKVKLR